MFFQIFYCLIAKYLFMCLIEQYINFAIIIRALHVYEPNWYRDTRIRWFVYEYYQTLRIILNLTSEKYRELTRCVHCGIYLITSCSNRGRKDIRCPFGCREKHKKDASNKRSTAYYKTEQGQIKRRIQNVKRDRGSSKRSEADGNEKPLAEDKSSFVGYLRFIISLIEGRFISWQEIKDILLEYFKKWRQLPLEYWLKLCNMTV